MEKNNGAKIIAVLALVVAVAGLSLGFAAYSTSLKIDTAADVTAANNWAVGFSTDGLSIENVSTARTKGANETGNPGVIDVKKYTISQNTNATLSTTANSSVSYSLSILNKGTVKAYLDSVDFDNVAITCSNPSGSTETMVDGVEGAGTKKIGGNTTTVSAEDCAKMFGVSLTLGTGASATTYTSTPASVTAATIDPNGVLPVTLTVSYLGTTAADEVAATLDGDIIVNIGSISVVYTSTNPAGGAGA